MMNSRIKLKQKYVVMYTLIILITIILLSYIIFKSFAFKVTNNTNVNSIVSNNETNIVENNITIIFENILIGSFIFLFNINIYIILKYIIYFVCVSSAIARWAIRLAVRLLPVGQYAAVACYFASLNTHALLGYVLTSLRAYASPCVQTPLGDSEKTAIFRMQQPHSGKSPTNRRCES